MSLARRLETVYSLDKELAKVKEVTVVNPFPEEIVEKYHKYMSKILTR